MEEEKNKQSSSTLNQENVDLKEKAMLPKKIQQRISSTTKKSQILISI